jgi:negative regulator of flagellin synthesis FlgM
VLKFSEIQPLNHPTINGALDVTTKITGYQNRPVQASTDKSVSRARDAGTSSAESAAVSSSPVQITDQARQLAALEHAVQSLPVVNESRVAEISMAIDQGRYEISPERIADKLLRMDRDLSAAER